MATVTSPCEGSNGTTVTVSNTGASRNFDVLSGTATFTTAQKHGGTTSLIGTNSVQLIWTTTASKVLQRGYFYVPATFSGDHVIDAIYYDAAGVKTRGAQFLITGTTMFPRLQTQGSGTLTTRATGGSAMSLNTWYRYELYADAGTSTTTGSARAALYVGDSTTAWWDSTLITAVDTAGTTGVFAQSRHNVNVDFYADDIAYKDATDAVWGAWPSIGAPVASAVQTVQQEIDFTSSSGASSLSATQTSGPTVTVVINGLVATFDDTAARTLPVVIDFTVTGAGGTDVETVTVPPIAGRDSLRYRIWDGTSLS